MSTLAPEALAVAGTLLIGASVACACLALATSTALAARLQKRVLETGTVLLFLRANATGNAWVQIELGICAVAAGVALLRGELLWLALPAVVIPIAQAVLLLQRDRRVTAIEAQLDRFLVAMAHSLRANPALADALVSSTRLIGSPLKDEIDLVLREHALGTPLDRALAAMAGRIGSPIASSALATLRVARASGGDLSATLETSAAALREMARLEGVVRTKTAEARAQGVVIAVIPFPMFATLHAIDPRFLRPVLETSVGHIVLAVATLAWLAAVLAARRIAQVDI
jgi:tight adherence protein B